MDRFNCTPLESAINGDNPEIIALLRKYEQAKNNQSTPIEVMDQSVQGDGEVENEAKIILPEEKNEAQCSEASSHTFDTAAISDTEETSLIGGDLTPP